MLLSLGVEVEAEVDARGVSWEENSIRLLNRAVRSVYKLKTMYTLLQNASYAKLDGTHLFPTPAANTASSFSCLRAK